MNIFYREVEEYSKECNMVEIQGIRNVSAIVGMFKLIDCEIIDPWYEKYKRNLMNKFCAGFFQSTSVKHDSVYYHGKYTFDTQSRAIITEYWLYWERFFSNFISVYLISYSKGINLKII